MNLRVGDRVKLSRDIDLMWSRFLNYESVYRVTEAENERVIVNNLRFWAPKTNSKSYQMRRSQTSCILKASAGQAPKHSS
jgi:hypothetical protein